MTGLSEHVARRRNNPNSMTGLADSALQGVTVSFLSQVFRMDPARVKRKLVNCPILKSQSRGTTQVQHIYDLATASKFLVDPEIDAAELIASIRKEDLPPAINTAYWDALLKRQKFEENAGDLWRTSKVWETLSDTFQTMKFTIQLWAETIERQTGLTEAQRELLQTMADNLQQELYVALVKQAEVKRTGSQLDEIPDKMKVIELVEDEDEEDLDGTAASLI